MKYLKGLAWSLMAIFIGAMMATVESSAYEIPYHRDTLVITDVNKVAAIRLCNSIKLNDVVIVASNGGPSNSGLIMMTCLHRAKARVILVYGHSAGSALAFAASEVCFAYNAIISVHRPTMRTLGGHRTSGSKKQLFAEYIKMELTLMGVGVPLSTAIEYTTLVHESEGKPLVFEGNNMVEIKQSEYAKLLGSKYKGVCDTAPYVKQLQRIKEPLHDQE